NDARSPEAGSLRLLRQSPPGCELEPALSRLRLSSPRLEPRVAARRLRRRRRASSFLYLPALATRLRVALPLPSPPPSVSYRGTCTAYHSSPLAVSGCGGLPRGCSMPSPMSYCSRKSGCTATPHN